MEMHIILLCSFQLAKKIDTLSTIQYNKHRAIRELIRHTPELTIAPVLMHRGYSFCKGASISGSHHQYKHPTKPGKVTIPRHVGDLDKGTVNSILRQAGLK